MASVNEKLDAVGDLSKLVTELQSRVNFLSGKYDEVLTKIKVMEEEKKKDDARIKDLSEQAKWSEGVIVDLQTRLRNTEQYARNKNIEISGVEEIKGEDLKQIMNKIAHEISVPFDSGDIDVIHRLPTRRGAGAPRIVAQFKTRTIRNLWLKNKNYGGVLTSKEVVPNGTSSERVYLNTHLTPEWKHLLWFTKMKCKPLGYKIIWFQENKIYLKKDLSDTRAKIITSEYEVESLVWQKVNVFVYWFCPFVVSFFIFYQF